MTLLIITNIFTLTKTERICSRFFLFIFASQHGANFHDSIQLARPPHSRRRYHAISISSLYRAIFARWIILARHSHLGEGDRTHHSLPTYDRETAAGELTVKGTREIGNAGNNALYQAHSLVKRIYPDRTRDKSDWPDLVRGVAINITHEFIVVCRRAGLTVGESVADRAWVSWTPIAIYPILRQHAPTSTKNLVAPPNISRPSV